MSDRQDGRAGLPRETRINVACERPRQSHMRKTSPVPSSVNFWVGLDVHKDSVTAAVFRNPDRPTVPRAKRGRQGSFCCAHYGLAAVAVLLIWPSLLSGQQADRIRPLIEIRGGLSWHGAGGCRHDAGSGVAVGIDLRTRGPWFFSGAVDLVSLFVTSDDLCEAYLPGRYYEGQLVEIWGDPRLDRTTPRLGRRPRPPLLGLPCPVGTHRGDRDGPNQNELRNRARGPQLASLVRRHPDGSFHLRRGGPVGGWAPSAYRTLLRPWPGRSGRGDPSLGRDADAGRFLSPSGSLRTFPNIFPMALKRQWECLQPASVFP